MTDDVRASTADAYDQIVADFVRRNTVVSDDFVEFRAGFVAELPRGGRVADLGCGPGRDSAYFRTAGLEVAALDASREMARRAFRDGVPVAQGDLRAIPFRYGSLDGIWSAASLLHVPRPDVPRTLHGWWRSLGPGGTLGLATSLGDDEGWEACPYDPSTQSTRASLRRWFVHHTDDALLALVDAAGFEVISAHERFSHRRWFQILARRRDA